MEKLTGIIENLPGAVIVKKEPAYMHAEFRSTVFRFVDDVEFLIDEAEKVIHLRSASRTGYWDFGVNRKRIETIRRMFEGN